MDGSVAWSVDGILPAMNDLIIAIRGATYAVVTGAVADSAHRLVKHAIQGALVDTVTGSLVWPAHSVILDELYS
jgi:hypothetical protein